MIKLVIAGISGRMGRAVVELAAQDDRFDVAAGLTVPGDPLIGSSIPFRRSSVEVLDSLPSSARSDTLAMRPCDVLIDFTVADGTMQWLGVCERQQIPMVIGATGHSQSQLEQIKEAAHAIPIIKATNFSPGIQAILNVIERVIVELGDGYDVEIVETHHRHKIDAPSGTALTILEAIQDARKSANRRGSTPEIVGSDVGDAGAVNPADVGRPHEQVSADSTRSQGSSRSTPTPPRTVFGRHGRTGERTPGEIGIHSVRMGEHIGRHEIHLSGSGETLTLQHTAHTRNAFAAGALRAAAWIVSRPPGYYTMSDVLNP